MLCHTSSASIWGNKMDFNDTFNSLREHFDVTVSHYQEKWIIKECMEKGKRQKHRALAKQRNREEFMPKGQKPRVDTIHQLSGFDLRALVSRQSH